MIDKEIVRKLFLNKRNNQVSLTLPKDMFRDKKMPKKIKLKIEELLE